MFAFVLLLVLGDPVSVHLAWEGGDLESTPALPAESHDATNRTGSGVTVSETAASEPVSQTAICQCRGSNRGTCFCLQNRVTCKCNANKGSEWLMVDGRAVSKTGKYANPNDVAVSPAAPFTPTEGRLSDQTSVGGRQRPEITIAVAPFFCAPCNLLKSYNWDGFDVKWVTGGDVRAFPEISWQDKRGVKRILTGAYRPDQVKWSWERTQ